MLSASPLGAAVSAETAPFFASASATSASAVGVATQYVGFIGRGVQQGTSTPVELIALDAYNRPAWGYSGTATLTSTDSAATFPAQVTFKNGVAIFSVTFNTVGKESVTATDTSSSSITGSVSTTVSAPAVATQLMLYMRQNVQAGSPTMVQLAALDANNRLVQNFTGTVTLTSSDPNITLPATTITFVNGIANFAVTFNTAGTQTLQAAVGTLTSTAVSTTVAAAPVASQYFIQMNPAVKVGVATTVTVYAVDANYRLITSYSGTANLSSSTDPTATFSVGGTANVNSVTFKNGVATFQVTFDAAGAQKITVADAAAGSTISATATTNVQAPAVASKYSLQVASSVTAGTAATVTLSVVDSTGKKLTGYSGTANLTSSDATAVFSVSGKAVSSVSIVNGTATFQVTFGSKTTGAQTITATDAASGSTVSGQASLTVTAPTTGGGGSTGTIHTTSTNWGGYAVETNVNNPASGVVTYVAGTWNVPTVSGSGRGASYNAQWVGIDGYDSSSVEQIGTEADVVNGVAQYSVWYEMYPDYSHDITTMTVSPGDSITASVTYLPATQQFKLTITDNSKPNDSFTILQKGSGLARSSAEWIVEAPSSNSGVLPLANFSPVTFTNAVATINGVTGPIDGTNWQSAQITLGTRNLPKTTISAIIDSGSASSFTVSYGTTAAANSLTSSVTTGSTSSVGSSGSASTGGAGGLSVTIVGWGGWGSWYRPSISSDLASALTEQSATDARSAIFAAWGRG